MAQPTQGGFPQGIPQASAPFVDETFRIQPAWLLLLISMWQRTGGGSGNNPAPIQTITILGSPAVFTASVTGHLWIEPGTYCDVNIVRGSTTVHSGKVTRGNFPMSVGDVATISFTTLPPTVYFV